MKVEVDDKGTIVLKEVYNPVQLVTNDGESIIISMRDSGFEFTYQGKKFYAKEGFVMPAMGGILFDDDEVPTAPGE